MDKNLSLKLESSKRVKVKRGYNQVAKLPYWNGAMAKRNLAMERVR
jgi:hypothetical protein